MAESTLTLVYADLVARVGDFLGVGRTPTGNDLVVVDEAIASGYRRFLLPVVPGHAKVHRWTFLTPTATLALTPGDYDYNMPDDFGGILGTFHYPSGSGYADVTITGEGRIMVLRASDSSQGPPVFAGFRPRAIDGTAGSTRHEVVFWPTPGVAETLTYRYWRLLGKLSATNKYPLGGAEHAETILECCLAAAELHRDDTLGNHYQVSLERLAASVELDRSLGPDNLGYNFDGGDGALPWSRVTETLYEGQSMDY